MPRRRVGRPVRGAEVRDDLVAAALRMLEATGDPGRVTVGAIVAEAGCTAPSLYHYWGSREALLLEASAWGFAAFRDDQALAVGACDDPLERIRRRGRAYLAFALERPALFRVLFLEPPLEGAPEVRLSAPGLGLQDLTADVAAAMERGLFAPGDPQPIAVALWSAVHGVAALWLATPGLSAEFAYAVADLQQRALLDGLAL